MHDTKLHTEPEQKFLVSVAELVKIKVYSSAYRSIDGTRELAYYKDEYGQMNEPSKSTDK